MVFLTGKRDACCSLLVMNGGTGFFVRSFVATLETVNVARSRSGEDCLGLVFVPDLGRRVAFADEARIELGRQVRGEPRREVPVLFRDERFDLALAIADEFEGDRLDAARAQSPAHLVPEDRADLVAHQAIEHAARLLRVDHLHVDVARVLERLVNRLLGDLVEHQPADFFLALAGELLGQVPADGLAFAVRVGRDEDRVRCLGGLLELLDDLGAARQDA